MKQKVLFVLLALCIVLAAGARERPRERAFQAPLVVEKVSVSGNLILSQGRIALNSGGVVYHVMGLHRFIGFIDGLKEGAPVTLEGYASANPQDVNVKFLRPVVMTLNGKSYELSRQEDAVPVRPNWPHAPRRRR